MRCAIAEGMAAFRHGFRRFTEVIDILVTRAGLTMIHEELVGLGYLPPFPGSKNLRDTELGVKIEFLDSDTDADDVEQQDGSGG